MAGQGACNQLTPGKVIVGSSPSRAVTGLFLLGSFF